MARKRKVKKGDASVSETTLIRRMTKSIKRLRGVRDNAEANLQVQESQLAALQSECPHEKLARDAETGVVHCKRCLQVLGVPPGLVGPDVVQKEGQGARDVMLSCKMMP